MASSSVFNSLSSESRLAPESGIVEVVNSARERADLIPLWVGEGDLPTPDFVCDAAIASMRAGETFYTYQRGIPELRTAIAEYHSDLYGGSFDLERFYVTGSGMQAIQIAVTCVISPGDHVLVPTPAWPNLAAAVEIRGGRAIPVPMDFTSAGWSLDIDRLVDAATPQTRAIFLNSPCNPSGWVASRDNIEAILAFARKEGLWIIADEIYARFYFGGGRRAPSFFDVIEPDDRVIFVNSFSKNWAMTGWRVGWLSAPPEMGQVIENLIQYSTSGVPVYSQRAAAAALNEGTGFLDQQLSRAENGRALVLEQFARSERFRFAAPEGAFYAFFGIDGISDTRQLALDLVRETGVGLAPGSAFGDAGQGFLRLCFARREDHVREGLDRIVRWIDGR
ncbi:pyridoxal phosphate-dependent aminotransferase [Roseibium hamelinense]|nr:pyridoxal phosphate-dependent aminotransferase [Roseibium hamelinense]